MTINRVAPEPFGTIINQATDGDCEWFEQHQFPSERYRRMVTGELWPMRYPDSTRVVVEQLKPGVRARQPLSPCIGTYDEDEMAIVEEHVQPIPPGWLEAARS